MEENVTTLPAKKSKKKWLIIAIILIIVIITVWFVLDSMFVEI